MKSGGRLPDNLIFLGHDEPEEIIIGHVVPKSISSISLSMDEVFSDLPDPPWHRRIRFNVTGWLIVTWANFKGWLRETIK